MRRKSKSLDDNITEDSGIINLTPLIDVVFVVLIMFIIIAPMLEVDKVALASSSAREDKQHPSLQQENALSIYVREDNSIWINNRVIRLEDLGRLLKKAREQNPRLSVKLFQDKKAQFGTYQMIKNAVELSGFEELDVVLSPG